MTDYESGLVDKLNSEDPVIQLEAIRWEDDVFYNDQRKF